MLTSVMVCDSKPHPPPLPTPPSTQTNNSPRYLINRQHSSARPRNSSHILRPTRTPHAWSDHLRPASPHIAPFLHVRRTPQSNGRSFSRFSFLLSICRCFLLVRSHYNLEFEPRWPTQSERGRRAWGHHSAEAELCKDATLAHSRHTRAGATHPRSLAMCSIRPPERYCRI